MPNFEQPRQPEEEYLSDRCLDKLVANTRDYESFWESKLVADYQNTENGFSRQEQEQMKKEIRKLRENIIDLYEKNKNLLIKHRSQMVHLLDNSILLTALGFAKRYEQGKKVPLSLIKQIKENIELLNYYTKELNSSPELLWEELNHEDGYLNKFQDYFLGKIDPRSPQRILLFKFFRELEKGLIDQENFSSKINDLKKTTDVDNFLDIEKIKKDFL